MCNNYVIILLNLYSYLCTSIIHLEFSLKQIRSAASNRKSDPAPTYNSWVNVPGSHGHRIITRPLKFPVRKSDNELGRPEFFGRKQATQSHRWQSTRINIAWSGNPRKWPFSTLLLFQVFAHYLQRTNFACSIHQITEIPNFLNV